MDNTSVYSWNDTFVSRGMELELVWTYDERNDHLSVDFPVPNFEPETPILLNLGWEACRNHFSTHDFFGRRPRTLYLGASDTLVISFPPYDMLETNEVYHVRIEKTSNIHTHIDRRSGYVKSIHISKATKSLLWSQLPVGGDGCTEEGLIRRNTC